jgi:hypothetical protein
MNDGTEREECSTVKCHDDATTTLRMESDYESVTGNIRTTVIELSYCDDHAEMWLKRDRTAGRKCEVMRDTSPILVAQKTRSTNGPKEVVTGERTILSRH